MPNGGSGNYGICGFNSNNKNKWYTTDNSGEKVFLRFEILKLLIPFKTIA